MLFLFGAFSNVVFFLIQYYAFVELVSPRKMYINFANKLHYILFCQTIASVVLGQIQRIFSFDRTHDLFFFLIWQCIHVPSTIFLITSFYIFCTIFSMLNFIRKCSAVFFSHSLSRSLCRCAFIAKAHNKMLSLSPVLCVCCRNKMDVLCGLSHFAYIEHNYDTHLWIILYGFSYLLCYKSWWMLNSRECLSGLRFRTKELRKNLITTHATTSTSASPSPSECQTDESECERFQQQKHQ